MNDIDLCLEVVSRSSQPLRYIWRWISRKPLEIPIGNGIWAIEWSRLPYNPYCVGGDLKHCAQSNTWARDFKFGMQFCMGNAEWAHK